MLRGIRKASENWLGRTVMGVVMTLLAGSFAVWGINDIFSGFGRSTLAKVGSTEIPIEQFRQAYQDRLQQLSTQLGHPIPPEQASQLGLDRQVLGEMVAQTALDQRGKQMRLGLPDAEIARQITTNPQLQDVNGKFDSARFTAFLQNRGYTEQRFLTEQRQDIVRRQLLDAVSGNITPPKAWIDAINQLQNQQRSIEYLALGPAQAGDIPKPTPEQLSKYYDDHKFLFRAPEYRKIEVLAVTPTEMSKWMEISDDDVKKAYEAKLSTFTTPERRHIEQIIFPNMADAQAASDKLKSGTTFAALAAERGLKENDIDLGTITKARMVDPAVADAAFSLKEGETSAPVQGQVGTAIVAVLKIEPSVTKPLADVGPQLRTDIATQRAKQQVQQIHDQIEDDRAGGSSLTEAGAKEKLPIITVTVDRNGSDADNKPATNVPHGVQVINAAFSTDVGVDNDPIDADGGYIWYDVAAITPAQERSYDDVKADVEQHWRNDEIASVIKNKAVDLLDKLKSGTAMDEVASADNLKVQTASDIKRGGATAVISPRMMDAIFHTAKDSFGVARADDPTQWIVFRVTAITTPDVDPNAADAKTNAVTLQHQLTDDVMGQYVGRIENDLGTTINASALAQAMGNGTPSDLN
ncbi:MAG TPA: SurA N-terminal domain-containing protein [Xanthobacteraceae bacterium]|jgi:peptidyl-prolyl cis-trans isomerase D|nr:SurA N-terminal domain-containing protein [Xanthobacteraceae bacterium]